MSDLTPAVDAGWRPGPRRPRAGMSWPTRGRSWVLDHLLGFVGSFRPATPPGGSVPASRARPPSPATGR